MQRHPPEMHFVHADALEYLAAHGHEYDIIHASPVCRRYTRANAGAPVKYDHPDLIPPTRELLRQIGRPYIMENVEGAPLRDPILICGTMFELPMYRHRLFEFGFIDKPESPPHGKHVSPAAPMGRRPRCGELWSIAGNFSNVYEASIVMGMPWANQDGIRQAIPPVYTEWIGTQVIGTLMSTIDM